MKKLNIEPFIIGYFWFATYFSKYPSVPKQQNSNMFLWRNMRVDINFGGMLLVACPLIHDMN